MGTRLSKIQIGERFGRLVVIEKLPKSEYDTRNVRRTLFNCKCDCGNFKIVDAGNLKKATRSCGCLKRENARLQGKIQRTPLTFLRNYYGEYRRAARYNNRSFEITFEEFSDIVQKNCFYCGTAPTIRETKMVVGLPVPINGVDRIDSSNGYIKENIRSCCPQCNRMKLDYTLGEFLMKVYNIVLHQIGTQKEHREVALQCKKVIQDYFPTLIEMLSSKEQ